MAGKRIGRPVTLTGLDDDGRRALDGAAQVFARAGATLVDVTLPAGFDDAARDWVPLCAVECAIAHEKTYPARAADYGPVLAGDRLIVASSRGTLINVNPDNGSFQTQTNIGSGVSLQPVVAGSTLYILDDRETISELL